MTYVPPPRPDWYEDPAGGRYLRYWDGTAWTPHTRPLLNASPPSPAPYGAGYSGASPTGAGYPAQPYPMSPYSAGAYAGALPPTGVWRGAVDDRPVVRNMGDAVRVFFRKYAQFDGRASRAEYWYCALAYALAVFALIVLIWIPIIGFLIALALWAGALAIVVPGIAVTVRRLRDAGLHWAWIFIAFVPLGTIALIVLLAQPSKFP